MSSVGLHSFYCSFYLFSIFLTLIIISKPSRNDMFTMELLIIVVYIADAGDHMTVGRGDGVSSSVVGI